MAYKYRVYIYRTNEEKTEKYSCCMSKGFDSKERALLFALRQNQKVKRIAEMRG